MILTNANEWISAIKEYEDHWIDGDQKERQFSTLIQEEDEEALWKAAGHFRVIRSFKKNVAFRQNIAGFVFGKTRPETNRDYINAVEELAIIVYNQACLCELHQKPNKPPLTLSAMSKFLMLRFPDRGIVFDKNAQCALWALNGAAEDVLDEVVENADQRNKEIERFFLRWQRVAEPIIDMLTRCNLVNDCTAAWRTVDKFLWLRGGADPFDNVSRRVADATNQQRQTGRAIFEAGKCIGLFQQHP